MALADDINKLRQSGQDEGKILEAVKAFAPQHSKDIDTLLQRGAHPGKVLDAVSAHDTQSSAENKPGFFEKAKGAVLQSLASPLQGIGESARQAGFTDAGDTLKAVGDAVAPEDYQSGHSKVMDPNQSIGTRVSAAPQAIVEGAGGLATDLAAARLGAMGGGAAGSMFGPVGAGVGGVLGGATGFGGSYLARNWGNTAKEFADARTGKQDTEVTGADKAKALALSIPEAALSRVGLNSALGGAVKGSVKELIPQIAGKIGKAAVVDAATSGASDVLHQGAIDPSKLTVDQVVASTLLGGATGATLRTGVGAKEIGSERSKAKTFADLDPENGANLAKRFDGMSFDTTKEAFDSVSSVENSLKTELTQRSKALSPKLKDLQEQSGFKDDTHELVADVNSKLKGGEVVDKETLGKLKDRLGDHHEDSAWFDSVQDLNSLNKLKAIGNFDTGAKTFGGGITGSKTGSAVLNPFGALNKYVVGPAEAIHAGLGAMVTGAKLAAFDPTLGMGYLLAQRGLRKGAGAIDSFRGVDNPTQHFMERFGNSEAPTSDTMSKPSFRQEQVEQKARELAAKQAEGEKAKEQATSDSVDARGRKAVSSAMDRVVKENETQAEQAVADKAAAEQKAQTAAIKNAAKVWKLRQSTEKAEADAKAKDSKDMLTQASKSWKIRKNTEAAEAAAQAARERQASADSKALLNNVGASWRIRKNTEVAEAQAQTAQERQSLSDSKALLKNTSASWRLRKASEAAEAATQAKEEASNSAATKAAISNAGRIWKIRQASESASVSDATLALKVAKLKQKYENDRNKFAAQESRVQERQAKTEAKETARQEASAKKDAERKEKQAQRDDALKAKADSKNAKSENAPKAEPKAEKAQADTNVGDMVHVKVGNQTVSKSKDTIRNEAAWKASVHKSMTIRHHVTEAVKKIVGKEHHKDATEMLTRFNNAEGTSRHEAYMAAENFVNKLPEALQGKVFDAIDKPELWSTFKDK